MPDLSQELADIMRERGTAFVFRPQVHRQSDGSWLAHYPGADWSVTGDDSLSALEKLGQAQLDRLRDPGEADWQTAAVRQHLENGPVPGVYEIDNETHARIHSSQDPQAELNAVIAALDRQH
ncbi:hypothetical protein JF729_18540 [Mycobacterium intracellulare]|uniref:hypothetical protein n=1 Tax=Mycobacterium intracellulare TaxID=1767 RepID=UPI001CDA3549|nr:hypothetical protein [Mycobacterium intracellulare]MCA2249779.1 hypothetical protein [Mycobacterium intracellulare]